MGEQYQGRDKRFRPRMIYPPLVAFKRQRTVKGVRFSQLMRRERERSSAIVGL